MSRFTQALVAFIALAALSGSAKPAAAIEYPWCAQYNGEDGGGRNCGFVSYDQCMLTINGAGGSCERNLFYDGPAGERPKAKRKRPPQG